jgi:hypothetical protein
MPTLIASPTIIRAEGNKPKRIEGYAGRVNWPFACRRSRRTPCTVMRSRV